MKRKKKNASNDSGKGFLQLDQQINRTRWRSNLQFGFPILFTADERLESQKLEF